MTCGGWPGNITANDLNKLIPYKSQYFPAIDITAGAIKPTCKKIIQIDGKQQAITVHEFVKPDNTECYFTWQFRNHPIDLINPSFKLAPQFIQISQATKPNPNEFAYMEFSIGVSYEGTTIDYTLEGVQEVQKKCLVDSEYKSFLGSGNGKKAVSIPTLFGDGAILNNKFNFLQFEIERFATDSKDTFSDSIYLIGCGLQYKTDFNNVSEWPV